MKTIEEISELEALVTEGEPESPPDNTPLTHSKWAFTLGIFGIDLVTSWTVWRITGYPMYGVIWFAIGAVSFVLHQRNWERAGNNDKQEKGAKLGMGVSIGAMLIIGAAAAVLLVAKIVTVAAEAVLLVAIFGLAFFHIFKFAEYYFSDDDWVIRRDIAKALANSSKKIKIIDAGDKVVSAAEIAKNKRNAVYNKHGDKGAVDAAIGQIGNRKGQQNQPQSRPQEARTGVYMPVMAKDINAVELAEGHPTKRER